MTDKKKISKRKMDDISNIMLSQEKLKALFIVSQKINQISDTKELLNEILNLAISNIEAERGIIILVDESGEICYTLASESLDEKEITFSRSIVEKALSSNEILLSLDMSHDKRFRDSDSIKGLNILSFVCVPLLAQHFDHPLGILYVDQRLYKKTFTNDDIAFLKAFANLAAIAISNANLMEQLRLENVKLREEVGKKYGFPGVIGQGKAMQKVFSTVNQIMNDDCTVLITGESGTGKEILAKAIHYNGNRKEKAFIAINCGALPENLLEAELFGSVKGAFTGAVDKKGLFQAAQGGTVFLDEIQHTSEAMQIKLLRFLQDKEIRRVGGTKPFSVDVRLICATNEDLRALIKAGRFRQDFYYRINVVTLDVPPLRERREDIPLLAEHFLTKISREKGKRIAGFDKKAMKAIMDYDWAENNVRELENEIERLVIFAKEGGKIALGDLSEKIQTGIRSATGATSFTDRGGKPLVYEEFEKQYIQQVLQYTNGNKTQAAKLMGIPRSTLRGKMRKLGFDR